MNTEQLKTYRTKEEILYDAVHGDELYFPYWRVKHRIEKAMQDFASQESKRAVDEFKDKLRSEIGILKKIAAENKIQTGAGTFSSAEFGGRVQMCERILDLIDKL